MDLEKKLNEIILKWRNSHNPWTGKEVIEILNEFKIGTILSISYTGIGDGTKRKFYGNSKLTKLEDNLWLFESKDSTWNGTKKDVEFAQMCIEADCIYADGRVSVTN